MDRCTFLSRKQLENESLEHFHAALTALAAKCQLRELEIELVRDLFITNMNNLELQRKFLRKTWDAAAVLEEALAWQRGVADQGSLTKLGKSKLTGNTLMSSTMDAGENVAKEANAGPVIKMEPISAIQRPQNSERRGANTNCRNCGNQFGSMHMQRCPAPGKVCQRCGKSDHFARVCRSSGVDRPDRSQGRQTGKPEGSKRMRFIEQSADVEGLLEAESQVRAVCTEEREEGEISAVEAEHPDTLDIHMRENDLDDYGILAVQQ